MHLQKLLAPVTVAVTLSSFTPAQATMPETTTKPKVADLNYCLEWAREQSDDVFSMWGIKESGGWSKDFAILRLASDCVGDAHPELAGITSSAGVLQDYCANHPKLGLCGTAAPVQSNFVSERPTWHGDTKLIEYGVDGTDSRSIRITCDKGQLYAAGPFNGGKTVSFEVLGGREVHPVKTLEAGDGTNYETVLNPHSLLIAGLLSGREVIIRDKSAVKLPGKGSQALVQSLIRNCDLY